MMMEVRCCCQPQKLLGWLYVPDAVARRGACVKFHTRPVAPWMSKDIFSVDYGEIVSLPIEEISIPIYPAVDDDGMFIGQLKFDTHLALKSEETPLEVLRRISSFVEASGDMSEAV